MAKERLSKKKAQQIAAMFALMDLEKTYPAVHSIMMTGIIKGKAIRVYYSERLQKK